MIHWSERTKDADKSMKDELKRSEMAMGKEERERAEMLQEMNLLSHGWIYKTAEEMSEETMMKVSKTTMGTYLKELVEKGWLDKRKNPVWKGDNTFQYRVNLIQIQTDLQKLGYALEGYPLLINEFKNETSESNNLKSDNYPSPVIEHRSSEIGSIVQKLDRQSKNWTTLPETTTEITSDTTLKISSEVENPLI